MTYGSQASSVESLRLDNNTQNAGLTAFLQMSILYPGLTYQKKLTKDQIPGNIGACKPDGGIIFYNGKPIVAIEAKHQLDRGNAIERWYKNLFVLRAINPMISYVTFASGSGVLQGNPIYNTLHIAHPHGYNVPVVNGNSAYLNQDGHNVAVMVEIICNLIEQTITGE